MKVIRTLNGFYVAASFIRFFGINQNGKEWRVVLEDGLGDVYALHRCDTEEEAQSYLDNVLSKYLLM